MNLRPSVESSRRWPLATTAAVMVAVVLGVFRWSADLASPHAHWVDLDVYQRGARALLDGEDLYAVSVHGLYFTYPPFGAAIFTPLSALPEAVARWGFTGVSVACFILAMVVVARRADLGLPVAIAVSAAAAWSEPLSQGLVLGQINTILMAMVLVDLLVVGRGRQGVLVGLAAGIKLVPAVFVLYFVLKRDWRSVGRVALGFVVSVLVGAVFDPGATWRYWTGGFLTLGKFGPGRPFASDNQSLTAFLDRIFRAPSLPLVLTLVGGLVGIGLGVWVARRALARGEDLLAVLALAVGGLLGSPVSWSHHWIWFAPVALVLAAHRRWVALWLLGLPFLIGPFWLMPVKDLQELHYSWWQLVVSGCYPIAGLAVLALWGRRASPVARERPADRSPRPPGQANGVLPGGEGRHRVPIMTTSPLAMWRFGSDRSTTSPGPGHVPAGTGRAGPRRVGGAPSAARADLGRPNVHIPSEPRQPAPDTRTFRTNTPTRSVPPIRLPPSRFMGTPNGAPFVPPQKSRPAR